MQNETLETVIDATAKTMGKAVAEAVEKAFALRLRIHVRIAQLNGAEFEDFPKVIADAVASGSEIIYKAVQQMSEADRADAVAKGETE